MRRIKPDSHLVLKWMAMTDPNNYQQVKCLSNPIKTVTCSGIFNSVDTQTSCRVFSELLNLSSGIWTVCLDSVVVRNESSTKTQLKALFEVKTNLCTSFSEINHVPISTHGWLGTVDVQCNFNEYQFCPQKKNIFFTINNPSNNFNLYFTLHSYSEPQKYTVKVEFRLLFQRML